MLNDVDRQILSILQKDARIKFSDLAKEIDKPVSTVFERIKKLEEDKVIKSYEARLDPEKVGKGFTAFVLGQARLGKDINLDNIGANIAKIPEVLEVHFVTGEYDFLIKFRVKDQKEYYRVVQEIARHFGERGMGMVSPKSFKEETVLPL